jgi:hypothetical protein
MDPIQGINAVLSFYGDGGWVPYVCTSSSTLTIDGDLIPVRTIGDGQWKKYEYQTLGYQISLSGVFVFNDDNFRGMDLINTQLAQLSIPWRLTFSDDVGNIYTYQGTILIKTSELSSSVGEVVKATHTLTGSGSLAFFAGYVPCATTINSIGFTNLTDPNGDINVNFEYTGDFYQVMYSIDGSTPGYSTNLTLSFNGVAVGAHTITLIPICANGFQGTGMTQTFQVNRAATCTSAVTAIAVNTTALTATPTVSGTANFMNWSIDGGTLQAGGIGVISLQGIDPGNHSITITPLCLVNGSYIPGTPYTQAFTITQQQAFGTLNYTFNRTIPSIGYIVSFQIYVNGNLYFQAATSQSGTFQIPVGSSMRVVCNCTYIGPGVATGANIELIDTTTGQTLCNQTNNSTPASQSYTWTMSSDTYSLTETAL